MGIIPGLEEQGKHLVGRISVDWLILAIILLSASGAFGLGFLAGKEAGTDTELKIIEAASAPLELPEAEGVVLGASGGQYVASKSGKSYHLPWCSGAKLIKEENKIWFSTKEEAQARGYTPAGNCPGL